MDAADIITEVAGRLCREDSEKTMNAVTSIYEACTFQDITGQRVTKVINVLKVIEDRIDHMITAMGEIEAATAPVQAAASAANNQDDIDALLFGKPANTKGSTLHGPALPGQAKTQAEIDALFAQGF
jgi:chemotaxis protein CheZ